LRVNAQLTSTETGAQLWSERFDQPISDLAGGQEQIVVRLCEALAIGLTDIEARRSTRERPTNPDAFDLVLRRGRSGTGPSRRRRLRRRYVCSSSRFNVTPIPSRPSPGRRLRWPNDTTDALDRAVQYLERAPRPVAAPSLKGQSKKLETPVPST
jgi:hypothetical protein